MKNLPFILLALAALALASCNGTNVATTVETAAMYLTKPGKPPPADTKDQIAAHESWCYETLGYAECYPQPQDVDSDRLINVDPENRYPLTPRQYQEDLMSEKLAAK